MQHQATRQRTTKGSPAKRWRQFLLLTAPNSSAANAQLIRTHDARHARQPPPWFAV
jgi:hypothetical protein